MKRPAVSIILIWLFFLATDAYAWNFFDRNPAEIEISDHNTVATLIAMALDIDRVREGHVLAFVTQEEFQKIKELGFTITWRKNQARLKREALLEAARYSRNPLGAYHTYAELTDELHNLAAAYPNICRIESAGQSVQGRELWWIKITDNIEIEEDEPEFHYISTMHGDEPVGMELSLYFIKYLLENYGTDPRTTSLVDETEIWIMPLMNPDGYEAGSRYNANGVDLNRDFPDPKNDESSTITGRQPETQAVMNWAFDHTPTLAANFHTGALVVNYPWDVDWDDLPGNYEASPDDELFIHISEAYSVWNLPMWNNAFFYHGITNGAAWYSITGGMQDWAYYWLGLNEVTIELNMADWPDETLLDGLWEENREAMLNFVEQAFMGVRGQVADSYTGAPILAEVRVQGIDHAVFTDPQVGDYHRMLRPGVYTLTFEAEGYESVQEAGLVVAEGPAAVLNVMMVPVSDPAAGGGGGCFIDSAR